MSAKVQAFAAGPLTFRFDGDTGFLRDIHFKGHEILRGIYPAVRDREWATCQPTAAPPTVQSNPHSVHLRMSARVTGPDMNLAWTADIQADASGRLSYHWRAKATSACTTNRAGLCVLHAAEAANAPCVIEHIDGSSEPSWFPHEISPHQPFRDVRSLTHVVGRAEVAVRMKGEIFETEDQRNWTDASFKTYSRPLAWPRPYHLSAGEEIDHLITVEVRGEPGMTEVASGVESASRPALKLPSVGFTLPGQIPASLRDRVRALRPGHARVETTAENLPATLDWARAEAEFLDCMLIVAIRGAKTNAPDRSSFPARCRVHLFDADGNCASAGTISAWHLAGHSEIATGTLHHFTELNRNRPAVSGVHTGTVFGINAQVHASDDDSILETLSQHEQVARTARRIGGGRPLAVAPISLGRDANAVDSRLRGALGAQWLLGSLLRLASAKCVESATYFHTHGPRGFLHENQATPIEQLLLSLAGRHTLAADFIIPS